MQTHHKTLKVSCKAPRTTCTVFNIAAGHVIQPSPRPRNQSSSHSELHEDAVPPEPTEEQQSPESDDVVITPASPEAPAKPAPRQLVPVPLNKKPTAIEDALAIQTVQQDEGLFGSVAGFFRCVNFWAPAAKNEPRDWEVKFEDIEELKWLGSGAHGCVFMGNHNGETVAVKKLKELKMTLKEMKALKGFSHPNIIEFRGVCTQPPVFCIVMEYCSGSLYDVVHDQQIPPLQVLDWATQIASGMDYLHKAKVVHRDLKVRSNSTLHCITLSL